MTHKPSIPAIIRSYYAEELEREKEREQFARDNDGAVDPDSGFVDFRDSAFPDYWPIWERRLPPRKTYRTCSRSS